LLSPPLHEPAVPQLIITCMAGMTSRCVPLVMILMRSARLDMGACAQQEPLCGDVLLVDGDGEDEDSGEIK
jgi:hypothetical protein